MHALRHTGATLAYRYIGVISGNTPETYRQAYDEMAVTLESSGNPAEAREHRRFAELCGKLSHEMVLLAQAEAKGGLLSGGRVLEEGTEHWHDQRVF